MDSLFESLRSLAERLKARGQAGLWVGVFAVLGTALSVGSEFIAQNELCAIVGTAGGLLWFLAGYIAWVELAPEGFRARTDFRANIELVRRRVLVATAALLWFTFLFVLSNVTFLEGVPLPLSSAVVAVVLMFWRIGSAFPEEREALYEQLEAVWDETTKQQTQRRRWGFLRRRKEPETPNVVERVIYVERPDPDEYEEDGDEYYDDEEDSDEYYDDEEDSDEYYDDDDETVTPEEYAESVAATEAAYADLAQTVEQLAANQEALKERPATTPPPAAPPSAPPLPPRAAPSPPNDQT